MSPLSEDFAMTPDLRRGLDVSAKRHEIPSDYLSRMKMAYLDEGADPSHRFYGWVAGS